MAGRYRLSSRALPAAALWSVAGHLFVFAWALSGTPAPEAAPRRTGRTVEFIASTGRPSVPAPAASAGELLPPREPGERAATVPGPADAWHREMASPWPDADVDTPDARAAARGGGERGGTPSWTGRNDIDEQLRAQHWNDPDTYRLERHRNSRRRRSPESIVRETVPDVDNAHRDPDDAALDPRPAVAPQPDPGDPSVSPSHERAPGAEAATAPRPGSPAPPLDAPVPQEQRPGAIVTHAGRPAVKEGVYSTEADVRGPRGDDASAAQASNEQHPIPLELTRPSAGGVGGEGVAGPTPGGGNSARAPRTGVGQGGSPANLTQRPGGRASTTSRAQVAYFHKLRKRLHDHLVYPPTLAAGLEQGEVGVTFILRADGSVANVRVSRPSGFEEFDRAAVAAVRNAAPFGPVPEVVTNGRDQLPVTEQITFANPLIR